MHLQAKLSPCYLLVSPVSYSLSLSNSKMSTSSLPVVERLLERLMLSFARVMAKRSPRLHSIGSSRIAAERKRDRQKHRTRQSEKDFTRAFHNFKGNSSIQHVRCSSQYIYCSDADKVLYIWARWWNLIVETAQSLQLYWTPEGEKKSHWKISWQIPSVPLWHCQSHYTQPQGPFNLPPSSVFWLTNMAESSAGVAICCKKV